MQAQRVNGLGCFLIAVILLECIACQIQTDHHGIGRAGRAEQGRTLTQTVTVYRSTRQQHSRLAERIECLVRTERREVCTFLNGRGQTDCGEVRTVRGVDQ